MKFNDTGKNFRVSLRWRACYMGISKRKSSCQPIQWNLHSQRSSCLDRTSGNRETLKKVKTSRPGGYEGRKEKTRNGEYEKAVMVDTKQKKERTIRKVLQFPVS